LPCSIVSGGVFELGLAPRNQEVILVVTVCMGLYTVSCHSDSVPGGCCIVSVCTYVFQVVYKCAHTLV
jgi:hypothetical protein